MNKDLTDDGFLGTRLHILQPKSGYRAGIDAVMLAASVSARAGETVCELGTGVGVASLCLASRATGAELCGLELQPELAALATQNAERNALADRVTIVQGSLIEKAAALDKKGLTYGTFDHVMANPPYYEDDRFWSPPDESKAQAHGLGEVTLADWVRVACAMARPKGTVTFVHRADALPSLLGSIGSRLGDLVLFPLWPRAGEPAQRILVQGIKGSRAPLTLSPGLVLHDAGNGFTPEAENILRHGQGLALRTS